MTIASQQMASVGAQAINLPVLSATQTTLLALRVLSPFLVLLSAISLLPAKPPAPKSSSPITSVVVAARIPRRALILSLLSLSALSFLLDGLTFVVYAVFDKQWPQWTGIEVAAVEGLVAFSGLAALGAWKDVQGVEVWLTKRLRAAVTWALFMDIAQVVLLGLAVRSTCSDCFVKRMLAEYIIAEPFTVRSLAHLAFPAFRVLVEFPLLVGLYSPRVTYLPVQNGDEEAPTESNLLLPHDAASAPSSGLSPLGSGEASKYGTFRTSRSLAPTASGPTTRTPTPAPSQGRLPQHKAARTPEKDVVDLDPSWNEILRRIGRITPYLWPSKSRSLQLLALLCVLFVVIGRFVTFLVPLAFAEIVRIFEQGSDTSIWPYLFGYVGLRFLQSSGGLAAIRDVRHFLMHCVFY